MKQALSSLGKQISTFQGLDVIQLEQAVDLISFETHEFQSICPVTGQPDIYTVSIELHSTAITIESKSLKLFFGTFRDVGIFAEDLVGTILNEIVTLVLREDIDARPMNIIVALTQNIRGGIQISASSSWQDDS